MRPGVVLQAEELQDERLPAVMLPGQRWPEEMWPERVPQAEELLAAEHSPEELRLDEPLPAVMQTAE